MRRSSLSRTGLALILLTLPASGNGCAEGTGLPPDSDADSSEVMQSNGDNSNSNDGNSTTTNGSSNDNTTSNDSSSSGGDTSQSSGGDGGEDSSGDDHRGGDNGGGTGGEGSSGGEDSGGTSQGGDSGAGGGGGTAEPEETCNDDEMNQDETDIDCGGGCPACEDDLACKIPDDCQSGICTDKVCQEASCEDEVLNGDEASIDCGGSCPDCVFILDRVIIGSTPTTGQATVTWDMDNFMVSFQVMDTTPTVDSADYWDDDSVEIYLDLNNGKTTSFEANDFQISAKLNSNTATGLGSANFGAVSIVQSSDGSGYTIDITIPWSAIGAGGNPPLGQTIGFDLAVNDDTGEGARDAQLMLYGQDQNFNNTSFWGELTLN